MEDLFILELRKNLKQDLMTYCDFQQKRFFDLLLGYKNTQNQKDRYSLKYERALQKEWVSSTNLKIIQKYENALQKTKQFTDVNEYFREHIDNLFKIGHWEEARDILQRGYPLSLDFTLLDLLDYLDVTDEETISKVHKQIQISQIAVLKNIRDKQLKNLVKDNIRLDDKSINKLSEVYGILEDTETIYWITADNQNTELTKEQIKALLVYRKNQTEQIYTKYNNDRLDVLTQ